MKMEDMPNISQEELELIERFWQHRFADSSEESRLKERYITDEAWRLKADEVRLLMLGIQEAVLEDRLEDFHKGIEPPKSIRPMGWLKWAVAACTIGIISVGTLFFFSRTPEEKLFAQFYRPDPGLPTLMGVSDHYRFESAMIDYKMGDYKKAADIWKGLLEMSQGNDTLNYFIGSALMADKQVRQAMPFFDEVIADTRSSFLQDARWYKAMALVYAHKKREAILILEETEHPEKEDLLRKLRE